MPDEKRCPRCGATGSAIGASGMCASCLLSLAVSGAEEEGEEPLDADEEPPLTEAAYRILTILGRDESGTTYLGEKQEPRRLVTLQIVRLDEPFDAPRQRAFRERARALLRLSHPAIQPILEARRTAAGDGCVVAAYLKGPQIARYCESSRLDPEGRARLFAIVGDAIAHAHGRGVCHGRLGPDAVIVTRADTDAPMPVVVGFGLFPGEAPPFAADADALAALARALGVGEPGPTLRTGR